MVNFWWILYYWFLIGFLSRSPIYFGDNVVCTSSPLAIFRQIILFYRENIWRIVLWSEAKRTLYLWNREWEQFSSYDSRHREMTNVMTTVIENDSCHDNCHDSCHRTYLAFLIGERQMTTIPVFFCTWKICATGTDGREEINCANPWVTNEGFAKFVSDILSWNICPCP